MLLVSTDALPSSPSQDTTVYATVAVQEVPGLPTLPAHGYRVLYDYRAQVRPFPSSHSQEGTGSQEGKWGVHT